MEQVVAYEQEQSRTLTPVTVLVYLWCAHFAIDALMGFWAIHKTLAGLDIVRAGAIASFALLVGNGCQVLFGYLGDRGWRQYFLPLSMLLACNMCLLTLTDDYTVLMLLVLGAFLGSAAFHPVAAGLAAQLIPRRRAMTTAIFLTGGYAGYGLSQLVYAELYTYGSGAIAAMMVLPFIGAILMLLLPAPEKKTPPALKKVFAASAGKRMTLVKLYLLVVCVAMANLGMIFLLPEIMMIYGASEWMSHGGTHMIWVLSGGLGLLPFGLLSDRIGPRQAMLFANIGSCIVMALLMTAHGSSDMHLGIIFAVFGLCSGACHPIAVAYSNALMPEHGGTVSGIFMGGAWAVGSIGPALLSWIMADMSLLSVQHALTLVIGFWLATVVLCLSLPRARQRAA